MKTNILVVVALALFSIALGACASGPYTAAAIEAKVLDAQTGKPVEGAVVVAYWETKYDVFMGDYKTEYHHIVETKTDKDGKFSFPGWGPEILSGGDLDGSDPAILIFKVGYYSGGEGDSPTYVKDNPSHRDPYWNHSTITLKPFIGDLSSPDSKQFVSNVSWLNGELNFSTIHPSRCDWKKIPHMLSALAEQNRIFEDAGYKFGLDIIHDLVVNDAEYRKYCGSPAEFFKGLDK